MIHHKHNLLLTIYIPGYPVEVKVSESIRPKYYVKGRDRAPMKFQPDPVYDKKGRLVDPATGVVVIKNKSKAGKPRYERISGNRLSSDSNKYRKNKIVGALKEFYMKHLLQVSPIQEFPIRVTWDLFTTVNRPNFDLSNYWFYYKYFEDCLRDRRGSLPPIIPDDNIKYITQPASPLLHPIDNFEERGFVFKFYRDTRPEITNHILWRKR
jgi:hypothetical protein